MNNKAMSTPEVTALTDASIAEAHAHHVRLTLGQVEIVRLQNENRALRALFEALKSASVSGHDREELYNIVHDAHNRRAPPSDITNEILAAGFRRLAP